MSRVICVIVLTLVLPAVAYFWIGPAVESHRAFRAGDLERMARGWEVLQPWVAWPVLAVYGAPLLALAGALGWVVELALMADERRAIARREAVVDAHMRDANRLTDEAKRARQRDQALIAEVKRADVRLSRQANKERSQRLRAVGELKRRRKRDNNLREQLAAADREIERLQRALPLPDEIR